MIWNSYYFNIKHKNKYVYMNYIIMNNNNFIINKWIEDNMSSEQVYLLILSPLWFHAVVS